ncbi:MAG TPA: DUF2235 domain-containing protein [Blastocatellia bacterium]|nr:DUF2235 domain-containing protein [Blastocatellia bacterium]
MAPNLHMPRNFIICCDGTNNQFGPQNTSVVRLIQVLDRDPTKQRLYYDPGVGTLPEPSVFTALGKKISEVIGLAFGGGLTWKVEEAYSYLMDYWEPGDQVFLFGFSRGAYTARVLAGLLHQLGLLPRGNQNLVPYVMRLFSSIRKSEPGQGGYWELCDQFRWTFSRPIFQGDDKRHFRVHFLGVWDTVSSVGWVWDPAKFPFTARNPSIDIVRHAVSIDERRWFFRQNLTHAADGQDLQELWFPGVHSDVGGGYAESDGGLWRAAFEWMLGEAMKAGLFVDSQRLEMVMNLVAPSERPWTDKQHESLTAGWWPAEFFPKLQWRPDTRRRFPALGLGRHRRVNDNSMMHKSTLLRIRDMSYSPPNLSQKFVEKVRTLQAVPESLPFER